MTLRHGKWGKHTTGRSVDMPTIDESMLPEARSHVATLELLQGHLQVQTQKQECLRYTVCILSIDIYAFLCLQASATSTYSVNSPCMFVFIG